MIYLKTSSLTQQQKLQAQFKIQNNCYLIPLQYTFKISQIIRSISYQYFANNSPSSIIKLQQYIINSLNYVHSLDMYRQILSIIKMEDQKRQFQLKYIQQVNKIIQADQKDSRKLGQKNIIESFSNIVQNNDNKVQNFDMLLMFDYEESNCQSLGFEQMRKERVSQHTKVSEREYKPQQKSISQQLTSIGKLQTLLNTQSIFYSREQWKTDRSKHDNSDELISFKKKSQSIIQLNNNFDNLINSQTLYDIKRESIINSHKLIKPNIFQNYQKKIKNCILNAKFNKKRK